MAKAKITCNDIEVLKSALDLTDTKSERKAGNYDMYSMESGLIVNIYDTKSITIQGDLEKGKEDNTKVMNLIKTINKD